MLAVDVEDEITLSVIVESSLVVVGKGCVGVGVAVPVVVFAANIVDDAVKV